MHTFLCVCVVLLACAEAWTPIVVKNVTQLGPQISPDVTRVSRDGGYSVLLDNRIIWLFDDTECLDLSGKQLSFVSNTAAYAKDPNKNLCMLQDFGVEAVGREKKSGETDYAILADKTVGTGGWIDFSDDELYFNKERKGQERVAICKAHRPRQGMIVDVLSQGPGHHQLLILCPRRSCLPHWSMSTANLKILRSNTKPEE